MEIIGILTKARDLIFVIHTFAGTFLILNSLSLGPKGGPCLNSGFPNKRYTTRKPRMLEVSESHLITIRLSSLYASRTITSSIFEGAIPFEEDLGSWVPLTANLPSPAIKGLWLLNSRPPFLRELLFGAALFLSDADAIRPPSGSRLFTMLESWPKGLRMTDEMSIGLFWRLGVDDEEDGAPKILVLCKNIERYLVWIYRSK